MTQNRIKTPTLSERLERIPADEQPAFIRGYRFGFAEGLQIVLEVQGETEAAVRSINAARRLLSDLGRSTMPEQEGA